MIIKSLFSLGIAAFFFSSCQKDKTVLQASATQDESLSVVIPRLGSASVRDNDGNVYRTVVIDGKTWMAESLRTTKYQNGDPIPNITDNGIWASALSGAWCHYDNNTNYNREGKLYNFYAVTDARGLAPIGWHIATEAEINALFNFLGNSTAATQLTVRGFGGTNTTGFSAQPSGERDSNGSFYSRLALGIFWTSTDNSGAGHSYYFDGTPAPGQYDAGYTKGYAIRCVKDY